MNPTMAMIIGIIIMDATPRPNIRGAMFNPVAVEPAFILTGLEREVYVRSEHGALRHRLVQSLVERGRPQSEVDYVVAGLIERKLLIDLDDRLIALANREPSYEMPSLTDFPGHYLDPKKQETESEKGAT